MAAEAQPAPPPPPPPPQPSLCGKPVVVLKVGTSSLVDVATLRPRVSVLSRLAEAAAALHAGGWAVVLVSSGAVGLGVARLGLRARPAGMAGKQACAAVGQVRLMALYDSLFESVGRRVAQVLLTYDAFGDRTQYLNARSAFAELLRLDAVPIVNENDTVAVQELRVGDNDTLSALVATMVGADWLVLFTDVDALHNANPRDDAAAEPIRTVPAHAIGDLRRQMLAGAARLHIVEAPAPAPAAAAAAGANAAAAAAAPAAAVVAGPPAPPSTRPTASPPASSSAAATAVASPPPSPGRAGSAFGTGGMATKIKAAQLASAAGITTLITDTARVEEVVATLVALRRGASGGAGAGASTGGAVRAFADRNVGTTLLPSLRLLKGRKRWILGLAPAGSVVVDAGAAAALFARKSLFPAGVRAVHEAFDSHDAVSICDESGCEIARALTNYSSTELRKICGKHSHELAACLGYDGQETVAERDNIALLSSLPEEA